MTTLAVHSPPRLQAHASLKRAHSAPPRGRDSYTRATADVGVQTAILPGLPRRASLADKGNIFVSLLRTSGEYRGVMLSSWLHSFGNGLSSGCLVGLFARVGGLSSAQSFLVYALGESTDMLLFCLLDIYGTHRRDQARPVAGSESIAAQRARHRKEIASQSWVDIGVSTALFAVTASLGASNFVLLSTLLGVNMVMTCKNSYSRNLFTCIRQLGQHRQAVEAANRAGQTLVSMEALLGTASYHLASLSVQCLFLSVSASAFVPLTLSAISVGAAVTVLPKLYISLRHPPHNE